jgi:hypothetical protein
MRAQQIQQIPVIGSAGENRLPVVAPLNNVVWVAGQA